MYTQVEALAAANEQAGGQHWGAGAQPRHLRRYGLSGRELMVCTCTAQRMLYTSGVQQVI